METLQGLFKLQSETELGFFVRDHPMTNRDGAHDNRHFQLGHKIDPTGRG